MSYLEIAEELADFWWPLLKEQPWDEWPRTLEEIHDKLEADSASRRGYHALSRLLIAALIDRAGAPQVESLSQARIYGQSGSPRHREMLLGTPYLSTLYPEGRRKAMPRDRNVINQQPGAEERRRSPRHRIHAHGTVRAGEIHIPCQFEDISRLGARIRMDDAEQTKRPLTATATVQIRLRGRAARQARVAYAGPQGCGLEFIGPPGEP